MKKTIIILLALMSLQSVLMAQKYGFVDTDYVLRNIPAYEAAQEQLNQASKGWQQEIEAIYKEVAELYKTYQSESVFLSAEMKTAREEAIIEKEKQAKQLQNKYFGPDGELALRRQSLVQPIQEQIAAVISEMSQEEGLAAVFDKSSGVLYLDPKQDYSDKVLQRLGYK
ncbi:OmpH family outer membrane protein [Geofilum sp. OHC36d9]|uniref:OmpH family outer membrane protein n=1 Tax=Geofilum sp. OHC36d9 TaxID=3458413 RepID=UPI004033873D